MSFARIDPLCLNTFEIGARAYRCAEAFLVAEEKVRKDGSGYYRHDCDRNDDHSHKLRSPQPARACECTLIQAFLYVGHWEV